MSALTLTSLDRRVLATLNEAVGIRAVTVADAIDNNGRHRDRVVSYDAWQETRRVLRGAEHLGLATQRGGWWRLTPAGQAALDTGSAAA